MRTSIALALLLGCVACSRGFTETEYTDVSALKWTYSRSEQAERQTLLDVYHERGTETASLRFDLTGFGCNCSGSGETAQCDCPWENVKPFFTAEHRSSDIERLKQLDKRYQEGFSACQLLKSDAKGWQEVPQ